MKKKIISIVVCMLMIGTTSLVVADWAPGDGYKMHFPQLPDPTGWDVNFHDYFLGDDWQCTETGPVTDIHFWISWRQDIMEDLPYVHVLIFSNNPQGPGGYSQPFNLLWDEIFTPDQFIIAGPWTGDQGWLEPYGEFYLHDHIYYYQINIKNISNPFIQQNGTIYWLVIQMPFLYPIEMGWKTTLDHFMDAAVWGLPESWIPIQDPLAGTQIDFAFVITTFIPPPPEPDLSCRGSLTWDEVQPGSTVTGTFEVGNIGEIGSLLNWKVDSWPTWGTWSFTPKNGTALPKGSWVNITATVIAPSEKPKEFSGKITVINTDDSTDFCEIDVTLKTPKIFDIQFLLFFGRLFKRFPNAFPILRYLIER